MSDLADFLLARIGEDEDFAAVVGDFRRPRLLAECKAKRSIVEAYRESQVCALDEAHDPDSVDICAWRGQGLFEAVFDLAAIYANHPDYPSCVG